MKLWGYPSKVLLNIQQFELESFRPLFLRVELGLKELEPPLPPLSSILPSHIQPVRKSSFSASSANCCTQPRKPAVPDKTQTPDECTSSSLHLSETSDSTGNTPEPLKLQTHPIGQGTGSKPSSSQQHSACFIPQEYKASGFLHPSAHHHLPAVIV